MFSIYPPAVTLQLCGCAECFLPVADRTSRKTWCWQCDFENLVSTVWCRPQSSTTALLLEHIGQTCSRMQNACGAYGMLRPHRRNSSTINVGQLDSATLLLRRGKASTASDSRLFSLTALCHFTSAMNCRLQQSGAKQYTESPDTSLSSLKPQPLISSRYVCRCYL